MGGERLSCACSIKRHAVCLVCVFHLEFSVVFADKLQNCPVRISCLPSGNGRLCYGGEKSPVFYVAVAAASLHTDFKETVKLFFKVQISFFCLYLCLGLLKISGGDFFVDNERIRYYLGYGWVNRAAYCLMFSCLELLYLKNGRLSLPQFILVEALNGFLYIKTKTVFPMVLTFFLGLAGAVAYLKEKSVLKEERYIRERRYLSQLLFCLFVLVSFVLPLLYRSDNSVLRVLNSVLNSRLSLAKKAMSLYGLGLLGNDVQWTGSSTLLFGLSDSKEYFYVDCDYIKTAIQYGIVFCGFVVLTYLLGIRNSYKQNDRVVCLCILFIGALCMFEPELIDFSFNPFFLYAYATSPVSPSRTLPAELRNGQIPKERA